MKNSTKHKTSQSSKPVVSNTGTRYQVKVIEEKCIGAASCVAVAIKTFGLDKHNIAYVKPSAQGDSEEDVLLAAQSCPTGAIEVIDTLTGEKVWPK